MLRMIARKAHVVYAKYRISDNNNLSSSSTIRQPKNCCGHTDELRRPKKER